MTSEQLGESLSAVMDGEGSDEDIQEVLDNISNPIVRRAWSRYQAASRSLQPDASESRFGIDLSGPIMAVIATEPDLVMPPRAAATEAVVREAVPAVKPVARWQQFLRPVASLAVAASVFAVVLVGSQFYDDPGGAQGPDTALALPDHAAPVGAVNTLGGAAVRADFSAQSPVAVGSVSDYDAIARERLERYLLPHTEEAALNAPQGLMPFARVATFRTEE
jgi:sigma-E factor negative regulatory protein RseA